MLKRDYILEMVEQLAHAIAQVRFLRQSARYEEAYQEIDNTCRQFFGLDVGTLGMFGEEDIVALLAKTGDPDMGKAIVAADLLKELGEVYSDSGEPDRGYDCYLRSLGLYLAASGNERAVAAFDLRSRIDRALELASAWELPASLSRRLIGYYESCGAFAEAEDLLFDLIENGEEDSVGDGIAFYRRLADRPDDELTRGNLPREELEEGLQELLKRVNSSGS
jgi:hypothetical protein